MRKHVLEAERMARTASVLKGWTIEQMEGAGFVVVTATDGAKSMATIDVGARVVRLGGFVTHGEVACTLQITEERIQRLQEISEADAKADGYRGVHGAVGQMVPGPPRTARDARELFWHSNNIKRATWEANPWMWAISFSRVT